jgi:hypothetical protein
MKKEVNLLEQFDRLNSIEPSAEWNKHLLHRLDETSLIKPDFSGRRWIFVAIFLLLTINLVAFSKSWLNERSQLNAANMKNIASEYLITSNSSKF